MQAESSTLLQQQACPDVSRLPTGPFMDCLSKAFYRIAPEDKAAYEERLRSQGVPEAEISSLRNSDFTRARSSAVQLLSIHLDTAAPD